MNLRAFHSSEPWLPLTEMPPNAPASRTWSISAGRGTTPASTGVHPTLSRPAIAACFTMSADGRVSVPMRMGPAPQ